MNDTKGITQRLIALADKDLLTKIEAASKPLDNYLRGATNNPIIIPSLKEGGYEGGPDVAVTWWAVLNALKVRAFENGCECNRQTAIDEFMAKVEKLASEIEEIKNSAGM